MHQAHPPPHPAILIIMGGVPNQSSHPPGHAHTHLSLCHSPAHHIPAVSTVSFIASHLSHQPVALHAQGHHICSRPPPLGPSHLPLSHTSACPARGPVSSFALQPLVTIPPTMFMVTHLSPHTGQHSHQHQANHNQAWQAIFIRQVQVVQRSHLHCMHQCLGQQPHHLPAIPWPQHQGHCSMATHPMFTVGFGFPPPVFTPQFIGAPQSPHQLFPGKGSDYSSLFHKAH